MVRIFPNFINFNRITVITLQLLLSTEKHYSWTLFCRMWYIFLMQTPPPSPLITKRMKLRTYLNYDILFPWLDHLLFKTTFHYYFAVHALSCIPIKIIAFNCFSLFQSDSCIFNINFRLQLSWKSIQNETLILTHY